MEIRVLRETDKEACADLWQQCFSDSASFVKWFFTDRYCPAYSACIEENGVLLCALHGYPFSVRIRDFTVPGAIIAGVSTHPQHRGKGLMKKLMAFEMQNLRQLGCAAVTHTPVDIAVYRSCGHFPCTDSLLFHLTERISLSASPSFTGSVSQALLRQLLLCYQTFAEHYSGIIARTTADMRLKTEDYFSDSMKLTYITERETVSAYAFYKEEEDLISVEEIIYGTEQESLRLLAGLQAAVPGKKIEGKLPPNFKKTACFSETEKKPQAVMGLVNPEPILSLLRSELPPIRLEDRLVPQNNILIGKNTEEKDIISMDAGTFMQLVTGYRSVPELFTEKSSALSRLEKALPKYPCYIIDAY